MMSYKEWRLKNEMAGTGPYIYNGEPATAGSGKPTKSNPLPANTRDYNVWGAPETANKSQGEAKAIMNKDKKAKKK